MFRRDVSKALIASAAGAALFARRSEAQTCTAPCYALTSAEAAAGVTPINLAYPPLYVDRYGTNTTPGITPMTAAFQAAIDVAKRAGGVVRFGATAPYLLNGPLNLTKTVSANEPGYTIRGEGPIGQDAPGALIAKHTGHVFDCTGGDAINFENIQLRTDAVTFPQTCFFFARNSTGESQIHRVLNCRVAGSFSKSLLYNYGSEDGVYFGNYFVNTASAAGTKVMTLSAYNIMALSSTFATVAVGPQSCIDHQIFGGQYVNAAGTATSDVFYLDGVHSVKVFGPWTSCGAGGRAIVYVDMTNDPSNVCSFYGLQVEHAGANQQQYGILFSNHTRTPTGWRIDSGVWDNQTFFLAAAGSNPTLDNFFITNVAEAAAHGISVPGTLQYSRVDGPTVLTLGTSLRNVLTGYKVNMAITTRTQDIILDVFTGAIDTAGGLGIHGVNAPAQVTGFGTPTGNLVINSFPGGTATLPQTSQTVAQILVILKAMGIIGA